MAELGSFPLCIPSCIWHGGIWGRGNPLKQTTVINIGFANSSKHSFETVLREAILSPNFQREDQSRIQKTFYLLLEDKY